MNGNLHRCVWHLTKRLMRYNIALSASAALATWMTRPIVVGGGLVSSIGELLARFAIAACTAGCALSFSLYRAFYRHELPIYLNAGFRVTRVLAFSWLLQALVLGILAGALLMAGAAAR